MNFHYRSQEKYLTSFNFSSLTDIVLLLLIFFLLTSSFIVVKGLNITLPKSVEHQPPQRKSIVVSIGKDKKISLNDAVTTKDQLIPRLSVLLKKDPDQQIIIRADKELILQEVVEILDLVKGSGATRLFIATDSPKN